MAKNEKTEETTMTAKKIQETLQENGVHPDRVFIHKGVCTVRSTFFYRHGETARRFAIKVLAALGLDLSTDDVEYHEDFNAWPKDSYFEVKFAL